MSGQYHLKTFLRRAPNSLLKQYLAKHGLGKRVGWSQLTEDSVERLTRAIEEAGENTKTQIGCDFRQIHDMANEGGVQTLVKEGTDRHHRVDLAKPFAKMKDHCERAFWTFLKHPEIFKVAQQLYSADRRGSWRKLHDLPAADPATDQESRTRLARVISEYYRHMQGRGEECQVDHYSHEGRLYWFAYPEDYAVGQLVYRDNDELCLATLRPAFEVIFVYDPEEQSLSTWVRGPLSTVKDLRKFFGNIILGVDLGLQEFGPPTYELDGLLHRDFPFVTSPEDGVETVRVKSLRIDLFGAFSPRLTLEANAAEKPDAVYDLLEAVLASERISEAQMRVKKATIQLVFRPADGSRARTLTFDVSHPDSCSLKYEPRHDVAKRLRKRWGIDVSGRPADGSQRAARPVQGTIRR